MDMDAHAKAAREGAAERSGERPAVKEIAKETFAEFSDDDVPGIAAEIAYHAVFAIPPMIIFLVAIAAVVNNFTTVPVAENLLTLIEDRAPAEMQEMLTTLVQNAVDQISGAAAIGLLSAAALALWSGSNGIATLMKAFNRAYDVDEDRSFVRKKLVAIGLTVLMTVLVIAAFALFVFGSQLGGLVADEMGLGNAFTTVVQIVRWPLAVLFIMFLLAVLYYLGPNVEQSFRWISPGSVLATLLWFLIVLGFQLYLTFSNPGSAYGALGSVVVLLFFLYLSGIAFVMGAELNAVLGKRYDPEVVKDLANHPEKMEDDEALAAAHQREQNLEAREGDRTAVATSRVGTGASTRRPRLQPAPHVAQSDRPKKQGGIGGRIGATVASVIVAVIASRIRRRRQRG